MDRQEETIEAFIRRIAQEKVVVFFAKITDRST